MRRLAFIPAGLAVLVLLPCGGCGSSEGSHPATLPVKGKVTYKGRLLTRGRISFEPDGVGREALGEIQPDGTYSLSTYKNGDGAVPGRHSVSVRGSIGKGKANAVPTKYEGYTTSKLEVEVTSDKADYPFDIP